MAATATHNPRMLSLRAATRVRLAVAARVSRAALSSRPSRLVHHSTRACAGSDHSNGSCSNEHFTVTTPLYYVNAGKPPPALAGTPQAAHSLLKLPLLSELLEV